MRKSGDTVRPRRAPKVLAGAVLAGAWLGLGAQCPCPDEAGRAASYKVRAGQLGLEDPALLSFDDCRIEPGKDPYFGTKVPTTLNIECGTPVLEPNPGQPLFRLKVPLGDLRDGADQDIDLPSLNLVAMWSDNGVPVGPSRVPEGGVALVRTTERAGSKASYPGNVTDDFVLEFTVDITVPAFVGRGWASFPGGTIQLSLAQDAADYRREPGPYPDCH